MPGSRLIKPEKSRENWLFTFFSPYFLFIKYQNYFNSGANFWCNSSKKKEHPWRQTKKSRVDLWVFVSHIWRGIKKHLNQHSSTATGTSKRHENRPDLSTLSRKDTDCFHNCRKSLELLVRQLHRWVFFSNHLRGASSICSCVPQWFQSLLAVMKAGSSCSKWPKNCFWSFSLQQNKQQQHNLLQTFHQWEALSSHYHTGRCCKSQS